CFHKFVLQLTSLIAVLASVRALVKTADLCDLCALAMNVIGNRSNQGESLTMSATTSLQGKVAVVTGGGRGIGKAITHRLAGAGANVVIASRKMENLQAAAQEFSSLPGKVHPVECHVGRADQLHGLIGETEKV